MAMTIDTFAKQYMQLAQFRGLTPRNPVTMVFSPNANDQTDVYRMIVSHTEPSFADVPYNVLWLVANSGDPHFMSVLIRTSHISDGSHRSSWKTVVQYDELFRSRQIYRRVVENASTLGLDTGDFEVSPANTTKAGTVILNHPPETAGLADVVSSSDPRMSDAREPTVHDHPDYPRTMVRLNERAFVEVESTNSPRPGYVLSIVDQDAVNPDKYYARWVRPTTFNVAWSSPRLLTLKVSIPSELSYVPDNSATQLVCTAEWEDRIEQNPAGAMWKIEDNALGITISPAGLVTVPDIGYDVTLKVTASMRDPVYGNIVTTEYPLLIKDVYRPDDQLTRIYITGAEEMFAEQREAFMVVAEYESGHTVSVLPQNFVSNSPALVLTGMIGQASAVDNDTTVTLHATYDYKGIIFEAQHNVLVKRQIVEKLEIIGPDSVLSEQSVSYIFEATWSNGRREQVTPTRFEAEPSTYTTISGSTVTAIKTTDAQYVVTLRAQYRVGNRIADGRLNLTIVPVPDPAYLVELRIEGATVVQENSKASYQFLATYSDGTMTTVLPNTFTSNRPDIVTITGSTISVGTVSQDTPVTLSASYTEDGIQQDAELRITILDVSKPAVLSSIRITGATAVNQNTRSSYKVIATYTDGHQRDITEPDSFVLAQPSPYATVEGLTLIVGTVPVPISPVTLNAVHEENGVRKTASLNVSLIGHEPRPVELRIEGADTIDELQSSQYRCRAIYSDNTNRIVDAVWTVLQGARFAEVDENGLVTAGSVDKNETIILRAQALSLTQEKTVQIINVMDVALTGARLENLVPAPKFLDDVGTQAPLVTSLTFSDGSAREAMPDEVVYSLPETTLEFFEVVTAPQTMLRVRKKLDGWYGTRTFTVNAVVTVDGVVRNTKLDFDVVAPEDEVTGIEIEGDNQIAEGNRAEYKVMVNRISGSRTEFTGTVNWQLPSGNATLERGTTASRIFVHFKTGTNEADADAWLEAHDVEVDGEAQPRARKTIRLLKDTSQPTSVSLTGPIRLTEGQRGTYRLEMTFADGSKRDADSVVVSYANEGNTDAFTFHGDNTITAAAVTKDELVLIKGQTTYLGQLHFDTLYVTNVSSTPSVEILSIIGSEEVLPSSTSQYRATASFSDGNTEEVTTEATWTVTVKSGVVTASIDAGGLMTIGATTEAAVLTLKCVYGGVEETREIQVTPQPVDPKFTPRWGAVERVTSMDGYNKAFAESLTRPLTDSGDQVIETQGDSTMANNKMLYTMWPKSLAFGYFVNITNGEDGPKGAWDGAAEFDDFNFVGGIEVTIEGEIYVIYRNDFALEDNRRVYRIRYGSSNPLSGIY